MGEFGVTHILVLAVILLVFFGPSRLPGLGQSIGKAIRGFKEGLSETHDDIQSDLSPKSQRPQQIPPQQSSPDFHSAPPNSSAQQASTNSNQNINQVLSDEVLAEKLKSEKS